MAESDSACTWVGVRCDANRSFVQSLRLPGVGLVGEIPANTIGNLTQLRALSLRTLSKFPKSAFAGNINLCGGPLQPCNSSFFPSPAPSPSVIVPPSPPHKKSKKLSTAAIIGISGSTTARGPKTPKPPVTARGAAEGAADPGTSSSKDDVTGLSAEGERNKLLRFGGSIESFCGSFREGKRGNVVQGGAGGGNDGGGEEIEGRGGDKEGIRNSDGVLGKIKHNNVLPLRAYYYSKDEKLLVFDFMPAGSLSALLHGESHFLSPPLSLTLQFELHFRLSAFLR
ncbi:unnamed protein product [Thlaspi arvense]|uniref:Uncharacterized protein n=1 Tax=Thlaspi arvense TaxID=13288 RepID=A0AAU9RGF7_THLAR|nr:unnamed protein product [Thlaspi arvense]